MTLAFLETLAAASRARSGVLQPTRLGGTILGGVRRALQRRRQRRAAACLALTDHLRRDVGLPPFDGR